MYLSNVLTAFCFYSKSNMTVLTCCLEFRDQSGFGGCPSTVPLFDSWAICVFPGWLQLGLCGGPPPCTDTAAQVHSSLSSQSSDCHAESERTVDEKQLTGKIKARNVTSNKENKSSFIRQKYKKMQLL